MKIDKKCELLAPAGSFEALMAAVRAGADAVYLAGEKFGARKSAKNFTEEELTEAVRFCHIRGVKVYVAINTLVHNREIDEFKEFVDFLYKVDVDALIVQDLGMLLDIKKRLPDFEVHASTQMTLHSTEDVLFIEGLGVSRCVVARELTFGEIVKIHDNTNAQLEVFASGALCVSYSGQCLMSSMIGGRSGNRGNCAQSCRQNYEMIKDGVKIATGYLLSPKDLSTTDMKEIAHSDAIDALKIEGRLKRPEYVYAIVKVYRAMIDGKSNDEIKLLENDARKVFSRGYTGGFVSSDSKKDMLTLTQPGNVGTLVGKVLAYDSNKLRIRVRLGDELNTNDEIQIRREDYTIGARVEYLQIGSDREKTANPGQIVEMPFKKEAMVGEDVYKTVDDSLIDSLKLQFAKEIQTIEISQDIDIRVGSKVQLSVVDMDGNMVKVTSDDLVQKAQNNPIPDEKIKGALEKSGGTPYLCKSIKINKDEDAFLPISALNNLRRQALEQLDDIRAKRHADRNEEINHVGEQFEVDPDFNKAVNSVGSQQISVSVSNIAQLEAAVEAGADVAYFGDSKTLEEALEFSRKKGIQIYFKPFKILHDDKYEELEAVAPIIRKYSEAGLKTGLSAGNYGTINFAKKNGLGFVVESSLNVFNSLTFNGFENVGAKSVSISNELNIEEIQGVSKYRINDSRVCAEVSVFGMIPVMTTEYCILTNHMECGECKNTIKIKDKTGKEFRVISNESCQNTIFNSDVLFNIELADDLNRAGIDTLRFDFVDESPEFIKYIVENAREFIDGEDVEFEGVKEKTREYYDMGITHGHLRRGVE